MVRINEIPGLGHLIYKETTLSKNLRNRSCKRPSSLYTEPRERRLPKIHIDIVNKQLLSFSTTIIHHLCFVSTTTSRNRSTTPTTTTTWQRHVTSSIHEGRRRTATTCHVSRAAWFEDDLARQRTCHVVQTVTTQIVVTVHMNSGKPLLSLFPLFTRQPGAMVNGHGE